MGKNNLVRFCFVFALCSNLLDLPIQAEPPVNAMMNDKYLNYSEVLSLLNDQPELCRVIEQSQASFSEFRAAFEKPLVRQTDFTVVLLRRDGDSLFPVGILVDRIEGDGIEGRTLHNTLVPKPGDRAACRVEQVVDWRYTDTFECMGARLYKVLCERQPKLTQWRIIHKQPFLLDWDKEAAKFQDDHDRRKDPPFHALLRDIANLRYEEVERTIRNNPELATRTGIMPSLEQASEGFSRRVLLSSATVGTYAAAYDDAKMIKLLFDLGVLREEPGGSSPLVRSAWAGNLETTKCLLDLGFDVNVLNRSNFSPLEQAVMWGHEDVVRLLLERGADVHRRRYSDETPLFGAASPEVAELLIAAGADVNAVDDSEQSCVAYHLESGHIDVARLLIAHGARTTLNPDDWLSTEEIMEHGRNVAREHFLKEDPEFQRRQDEADAADYGCVLPVRSIPVR